MFIATVTRTFYCYDNCPTEKQIIECATKEEALKIDEELFDESERCDTCYSTSWEWNEEF